MTIHALAEGAPQSLRDVTKSNLCELNHKVGDAVRKVNP